MANKNSKLENPKVVTITGGTSGIGAAIAQLFFERGHKIYILSRHPSLPPHFQKIENDTPDIELLSCDVRSEEQVKKTFENIGHKNNGIDISINCSGILDTAKSVDLSTEEFDDVIATNLKGVWLCMKSQIPEMKKKKAGSIVNISSIFGLQGAPGNCAYAASKHGVVGLTKTFAIEHIHDNIQVNCVAPSFTETPMLRNALSTSLEKEQRLREMLPKKEFINTADIAKTVYWLAHEAPASINGHCLVIDDGYTSGTII